AKPPAVAGKSALSSHRKSARDRLPGRQPGNGIAEGVLRRRGDASTHAIREELQFSLDWPEGREAATMDRTRPKRLDGGEVLGCGVTFVPGEAVAGILAVQLNHFPVASDFGQDTGCGNGIALAVAGD